MAEDELVAGGGWLSDESSFYGDEDEQEQQLSLCDNFNVKSFWSTHHKDLNVITMATRAQQGTEAVRSKVTPLAEDALSPKHVPPTGTSRTASKGFDISGLDRRAMEQERLTRLGKRKHSSSPEPQRKRSPKPSLPEHELFNPREGCRDSWQLDLLKQSQDERNAIHTKSAHGPKAVLTRLLNQESKALQQRIVDLAVEDNVLSGKWMLFPKLEDVTRVWKLIVQGVINGRLGPTAKVAPDDGKEERLICVYTKDFRDEEDVLRVLQELDTMGLLGSGRSLYYKSDAYTYLNIYKETAAEFGLQTSLYNSWKMIAQSKQSNSTAGPRKKQSTLNRFF